jgi:integrase
MEVTLYKRKNSKYYWMWYYQGGKRKKESTKATNLKTAKKIAKHKEEELLRSIGIEDPDKLLFSHLIQEVTSDYKLNNNKSLDKVLQRRKNLLKFFTTNNTNNISIISENKMEIIVDEIVTNDDGNCSGKDREGTDIEVGNVRLIDMTEVVIDAYKKWRSGSGIANSTINRELAIIKRGFNLLKGLRRIEFVPKINMLEEGNVREGFFEKWEVTALLHHLPPHVIPIVKFAYKSGWRTEEILNLTWGMVNLDAEEINLPPSLAKNKSGRKYPIVDGDLKKVFRQLWNNRVFVVNKSPYVFLNKNGTDRTKSFRKSWIKACKDAGIGERLFHDFRRTCVRNLIRSGTPEKVAMQITGHKTRNVFEAYNIVSAEDMKRALKKQEEGLAKQSDKRPEVSEKQKYYEDEGVTQIYPGAAYLLKVEGEIEEVPEGERRPFREVIDEIVEEYESKKGIIADSEGEEKVSEDGESDTGD